jgi:hypothetical protein
MPIRIARLRPRPGHHEVPEYSSAGYQLVSPKVTKGRNKVENATFVSTLSDAADLIDKGYSIRMTAPGLRPSLIGPKSVKVTR